MFKPFPKSYSIAKPKKPLKKVSQKKIQKALDAESIPKLVEQLDNVFSLYIRLKYADENGNVKCFTKGTIMHYTKAQAGHFISRRHYSLRWDENNVRPQSVAENIFNQGNQYQFGENLKAEIGEEKVRQLMIRKNNKIKLEKFILKHWIAQYTLKCSELKIKLGL